MDGFNLEDEKELENFLAVRFGKEEFKGELERTSRFFHPYKKSFRKIITVGGTNGKGETSNHLANLISPLGRTALWTSPHILSIRERFIFLGEPISYTELAKEFRRSYLRICLFFGQCSYYEFLFYVFIRLAKKKKIDYLVLEVGLGGRLDAVNHFDADIAIITSISRDHQAILGNTLEKILREKLGITRPNRVLITALELAYCQLLASNYCRDNNIKYYNLDITDSQDFSYRNKMLAAFSFEYFKNNSFMPNLDISNYSFRNLKGRFEEIKIGLITFIFVGSHNIDGARKLVQKLSLGKRHHDLALVSFSKRPREEIELILKILGEYFNDVILTTFDHFKAATDLQDIGNRFNFVTDWKNKLETKIKNQRTEEVILVTGSYYFVGEVQKFILDNSFIYPNGYGPAQISIEP